MLFKRQETEIMSEKSADKNQSPDRRLIDEWLPLKEINLNSEIEMTFRIGRESKRLREKFAETFKVSPKVVAVGTPQIRNLHPWLARRPCSTARALTCASLLPVGYDRSKFLTVLGLSSTHLSRQEKILIPTEPHRELLARFLQKNLNKGSEELVVVDPMAGGGSIPLESLRLGFKTIAMEYNPVAYIILKATLEYPAKYGEKLSEEVKREAKALIDYAKRELGKYYPEDAYNCIFARGFICPECKGIIPIIHNSRLRKNGPYIKFYFDKKKKTFEVKTVNHETEFEKLKCPYCSMPLTTKEVFKQWIAKHRLLLKYTIDGEVKKVKASTAELLNIHIPLIKQMRKGFAPFDEKDKQNFVNAFVDLAVQMKELKSYVPNSLIPKENDVFEPVRNLGTEYWYQLFNPRQLLALTRLIKYVSDRSSELIEKKGEYGAAVAIYLALGLSKLLNYNNIATRWDSSWGKIHSLIGKYSSGRRVGFSLEYCESVIPREKKGLGWIYETDIEKPESTRGGICPIVKELCTWGSGFGDRVEVYMGDACELSKILGNGSVDILNVDPPYFNQHTYSDLSEFFWQVLRVSLKPLIDSGHLFNRDEKHGRVECLVSGWSPSLPTVPRAGEIIVRRSRGKLDVAEVSFTKEWWREQMWKFFREAYNALKGDGMLIVWYTHSAPEAWEAVLSGLYASKFMISKVWNVRTEVAKRLIARGGSAFFTSLVLIARKTGESVIVGEHLPKELLFNEQVKAAIARSVIDAFKSARVSGASDREAYVMALAGAIAGATRIHNPALESIELLASETLNRYIGEAREQEIARRMFNRTSDFFRESLYPVALYLGASKVLEEELIKARLSEEEMKLIIGADDITRAYLVFWLSIRRAPFVDYDFAEKICKVVGTKVGTLETYGLINKIKANAYLVSFGQEVFDAIRGRLEYLDRTAVGGAMHLMKLIIDSPIKDDEERCARDVFSVKPVSKQVIATATFLLRTARDEELRKASISKYTKPFIEKVLKALYAR